MGVFRRDFVLTAFRSKLRIRESTRIVANDLPEFASLGVPSRFLFASHLSMINRRATSELKTPPPTASPIFKAIAPRMGAALHHSTTAALTVWEAWVFLATACPDDTGKGAKMKRSDDALSAGLDFACGLFGVCSHIARALLAAPVALCVVLCRTWERNEAEYAKGFLVNGFDGRFDSMWWFKSRRPELPCPSIVVHLPGRDLDNTHFSSSGAMRKLGGVAISENGDEFEIDLKCDGLSIRTGYTKDVLTSVSVRVRENDVRVTVDGKSITLPASKDELLRAFGQPVRAETSHYRTGRLEPVRAEPHL